MVRATARWAKYVVTFDDWLDFIVRKARRHTGRGHRAHRRASAGMPLLFLWPRVIHYLRHKDRDGSDAAARRSSWPCSAAALVSMAVYALRGRGRDADAERKGVAVPAGRRRLPRALAHVGAGPGGSPGRCALGLSPDFFNFAGLAFGARQRRPHRHRPPRVGRPGHRRWAASPTSSTAAWPARRKLASPYGTFIDSTLDRFVEVFAFLGFVGLPARARRSGPLLPRRPWRGSLLVSYTRARGESLGVLCKEGLMQRAERLVLTFLACWLDRLVRRARRRSPGTPSSSG